MSKNGELATSKKDRKLKLMKLKKIARKIENDLKDRSGNEHKNLDLHIEIKDNQKE